MKTIVIIQARMGSSRLPGKILMPLGNVDNLTYVTSRCKKIEGVTQIIVATSSWSQDDPVEAWCLQKGIACYRGSEDDVLDRFIQASMPYQPDYVVRVTADCPFVDYDAASAMIQLIKETKVDIIDLSGEWPRGLAVEVLSYRALRYIHEHGKEARHREHVTYYAYEYRDQFTRAVYESPSYVSYPELRITLDTVEDYELMTHLAAHFNNIDIASEAVIKYLLEHPDIAAINAHIEQKPVI